MISFLVLIITFGFVNAQENFESVCFKNRAVNLYGKR